MNADFPVSVLNNSPNSLKLRFISVMYFDSFSFPNMSFAQKCSHLQKLHIRFSRSTTFDVSTTVLRKCLQNLSSLTELKISDNLSLRHCKAVAKYAPNLQFLTAPCLSIKHLQIFGENLSNLTSIGCHLSACITDHDVVALFNQAQIFPSLRRFAILSSNADFRDRKQLAERIPLIDRWKNVHLVVEIVL